MTVVNSKYDLNQIFTDVGPAGLRHWLCVLLHVPLQPDLRRRFIREEHLYLQYFS